MRYVRCGELRHSVRSYSLSVRKRATGLDSQAGLLFASVVRVGGVRETVMSTISLMMGVAIMAGGACRSEVSSQRRLADSAAVQFMRAVKANDSVSIVAQLGNENGALATIAPPKELMPRARIMIRCLQHDKFTLTGNNSGSRNERIIAGTLAWRGQEDPVQLRVMPDRRGGWYVVGIPATTAKSLCSRG